MCFLKNRIGIVIENIKKGDICNEYNHPAALSLLSLSG